MQRLFQFRQVEAFLKSLAFRRTVVGLVLAHFLAIMAMAALPQLHELAHADAGCGEHYCAVTLFRQGSTDAPVATVLLVICLAFVLRPFDRPRPLWVESLFLSRSVLEHAPPTA